MAGASRLARFNITSNPQPSNPGRPGKKYFVGMPIPAGAGVIAAVVHFARGNPLESWYTALTWLAMVAAVGYLMVSTWRFYSFKDIDFSSRHPFRLILFFAALFASICLAIAMDASPPPERPSARLQGGFTDLMSAPMPPKSALAPHAPSARGNLYRAAIVGAASLKGKEVAEMLNERNFPAVDVRLLDDDESLGQLEAMGDEITFIQRVHPEQFEHVDFAFFASNPSATRKNWKSARDAGSTIIDLSAALENEPGANVRSLWVERRDRASWPILQLSPSHCYCCVRAGLVRSAAPSPRFSSRLPNTDKRAWTNCTSKQ